MSNEIKMSALQRKLQSAMEFHQKGRIDAAERLYREVLEGAPKNFDCLHLLGVAKYQIGQYEEAESLITSALTEKADFAHAYNNRGVARKEQGKFAEALMDFDKALELEKDYSDARLNRGNVFLEMGDYHKAAADFNGVLSASDKCADAFNGLGGALTALGRYDDALASFKRAIELDPTNEKYFNSRGCCWLAMGRKIEAVEDYDRAIELKADHVEALINKGNVLKEIGDIAEAEACINMALRAQPNSAVAYLSLGLIYAVRNEHERALSQFDHALKLDPKCSVSYFSRANALVALERIDEGVEAYGRAIEEKPDYAEAFNNRGLAFFRKMNSDNAMADYERAIALKSGYAEAHVNRGNVLKKLGSFEEAIECYSRALELKPGFAEAHFNRGLALSDLKRHEDAIREYDIALSHKPEYEYVLGLRLHTELRICKWDQFERTLDEIKLGVNAGRRVILPFFLLGLVDDPEMQLKAASLFGRSFCGKVDSVRDDVWPCDQKIRIGYFSADFYNHATSYLISHLLEAHNRSRFEVYGFSFGPPINDSMRQRVSAAFDKFVDVREKSDPEIAKLSREIGIDIAVDLGGYTLNARTGAFACRCAPVQLSYLGYPGTMGVDFIDYVIADEVVVPYENQKYFSEKVIHMPRCYQVNDQKRQRTSRQFIRADLGLPESGVVFCCFNNTWKILPSVFQSWMRILKAVAGSVLWLLEDTPTGSRNLRMAARLEGVDPSRLIFAPRVTLEEHLSRHRLADVFLDTLPYNAHTTASDALWSGVPVVTRIGKSFASRVAASLLKHVGLSDLIVRTEEEYEKKAIEIAVNPSALRVIKNVLEDNRVSSGLFDATRFTTDLEEIYCNLTKAKMYEM